MYVHRTNVSWGLLASFPWNDEEVGVSEELEAHSFQRKGDEKNSRNACIPSARDTESDSECANTLDCLPHSPRYVCRVCMYGRSSKIMKNK